MEQTDGEILLEMNHVKKSFDGNGVLEDISLTVKKGAVQRFWKKWTAVS